MTSHDPAAQPPVDPLLAAERLVSSEGVGALEELARSADRDVRVGALALLAIQEAVRRSEQGLQRARERVAEALAQGPVASVAEGRLCHAQGYIAFREANDGEALAMLNRAASLFEGHPRLKARVFDTLGMLLTRRGDLDGAYGYFTLAIRLKESETGGESLAITYGNLGRLELSRERYAEAERWLRLDLELLLQRDARPSTEAHVRSQIALALLGQGRGRHGEARAELERAVALAPTSSIVRVFAMRDLARLLLDEGDRGAEARASGLLVEAREAVERHGFSEALPGLDALAGRLAARAHGRAEGHEPASPDALFERAFQAFLERNSPQDACEVALDRAGWLLERGRGDEAGVVLDEARAIAEAHLFRQENPLARVEAMIERAGPEGPTAVMRGRLRRMLGGVSEHWLLERASTEYHARRLHGERAWVTVWTCDIRGFTEYCNRTPEPQRVVTMLNRFFARVGQAILAGGGCIDKYVGDSLLAYFVGGEGAVRAAEASIESAERVTELNAEREHLGEAPLLIGVGLATGWVVEGNVGFAGKLEHTIIGTPVNTACRLVAKANAGQVLLDDATRQGIEGRFEVQPVGEDGLELKGLGRVASYELVGRRAPT